MNPESPLGPPADDENEHVRVLPSAGHHEADHAADAALDDFEHRAAADLEAILGTELLEVEHEDAPSTLEPSGGMVPREAAAMAAVTAAEAEVPLTPVPAAAAPVEPGPDVEVECPGCGLIVVGSDPRANADWFCPRCDYPLFFVSKPAVPEPDGARKGARRRLPGVKGRVSSAAGACWNCGEWNDAGVRECLRCAATLPKPVPPQLGPFEAVEIPEPELVEVEVMYWPPVVISLVGGFVAGIAFLGGLLLLLDR